MDNGFFQCVSLADYDFKNDRAEWKGIRDELTYFCKKVNLGESLMNDELLFIPLDVVPSEARDQLKYYNGLSDLLEECLNTEKLIQEFIIAYRKLDKLLVIVLESFEKGEAVYTNYAIARKPENETLKKIADDPIEFFKKVTLAYLKGEGND